MTLPSEKGTKESFTLNRNGTSTIINSDRWINVWDKSSQVQKEFARIVGIRYGSNQPSSDGDSRIASALVGDLAQVSSTFMVDKWTSIKTAKAHIREKFFRVSRFGK